MYDYRYYDAIYHHGVKGMHWGVRKDKAKAAATNFGKKLIGAEIKPLNKITNSSGKLRSKYFEMQMAGVKTSKSGRKYTYSNDPEKRKNQQKLVRQGSQFASQYLKKYGKQPMNYAQSLNAQKGFVAGTALGVAVPIVLPLWLTIPAGYAIGSKIDTNKKNNK